MSEFIDNAKMVVELKGVEGINCNEDTILS